MDGPTATPPTDEENPAQNNARDQRPRSSLPSFLFISFMLFLLTSHNGDEFLARHQYQDALQSLTWQLSNYTAWMNHTTSNFTEPETDHTLYPLLDSLHIRGKTLDPSRESYYNNITGFIHGKSRFYNITSEALALPSNQTIPWSSQVENFTTGTNMTELDQKLGFWNWNSSTAVVLSVVEKKPPLDKHSISRSTDDPIFVHGRIELTDESNGENLKLDFEGVHFVANGSIHGFAEPPGAGREIDIRLLPFLVPESARNRTARIIAPELLTRIDKLKNLIDAGVIDADSSGSDDPPKTSCTFTFHAQMIPASVPQYLMEELEEELQNPTGISTVPPPKLQVSAVLLSKECGIMFEVSETEGLRSKTFFRKVTTYAGFTAFTYLAILILFARQSNLSRTPSGISRVSLVTFLTQATMDSVSFAGHITFAILAEGRPSLSLIAPAFLACITFIQEAQFGALIYQIQGPENYTPPSTAAPAAAAPTPANSGTLDRTATLPAAPPIPTAARSPPQTTVVEAANNNSPQSFFSFFIHHVRTDPQARLWVVLFVFLTLVVRVILSPTLSVIFVAMTYSSIWLPQIVRSVRRGRSSGLTREYVFGITACRLSTMLYFLACPKNVLEVENRSWVYPLTLFVCLQAAVVVLQDSLGPTFFLPHKYTRVNSYNYHPVLPLADSEAPEQSLGDCAICMDAIMVETTAKSRSKSFDLRDSHDEKGLHKAKHVGSVLNAMHLGVGVSPSRKNYSLAPCSHLFHTDCLEKWLAIKNICPQCRRPLPPL